MTASTADLNAAIEAYVAFYEALTPESVGQLDALCHPEVRFRDPFNDVTGIERYRALLAKMFEEVAAPRFHVTDRALSSAGVAYLRWTFTFETLKGGRPWSFEGMTEIHFDEAARITAHLDHWDSGSQFYARLPLLGGLVRLVRRKLSA